MTVKVAVRACKKFTFENLMLIAQNDLSEGYLEEYMAQVTLAIDGKTKPSFGATKQMRHGRILDPIQSGSFANISDVAVKQGYFKKKIFRVYTGETQLGLLAGEVLCAAWAHSLFELTKEYVDRVISRKGPPPFEVPYMRFVSVALATDIEAGVGGAKNSYLLEELIAGREKFVKYIHNGSAAISVEPSEEPYLARAEFLAFTQHYQYRKTFALAFISDYQGVSWGRFESKKGITDQFTQGVKIF